MKMSNPSYLVPRAIAMQDGGAHAIEPIIIPNEVVYFIHTEMKNWFCMPDLSKNPQVKKL